jgi:hypothetical protein
MNTELLLIIAVLIGYPVSFAIGYYYRGKDTP